MRSALHRPAAVVVTAIVGLVTVLAGAAYGADDLVVDHSELADGTLRLLVSVPPGDAVELDSVAVTIDGKEATATATPAGSADAVRRTTVLAIDTSNSMRGRRIAEAKAAAGTFLDTVPEDVLVGIVTFDRHVVVRLAPTTDRDAARAAVADLGLSLDTALYEGVATAVEAAGSDPGQHRVLVLSDGKDNTDTPLDSAVAAIEASDVRVDVVSLEQGATAPAPLAQMARAGGGEVISADSDSLAAAFGEEAAALARQVLVQVDVPDGTDADASVAIRLDAGSATYSGSAFLTVRRAAPQSAAGMAVAPPDGPLMLPRPVLYAALLAIALGAVGVAGALIFDRGERPVSLEEQFAMYSASEATAHASAARRRRSGPPAASLADQAKQMAEKALSTNRGLEARIANRLEGAGMALKASEWLLLHLTVAFVSGVFGLVVTGGNPLGMVVFLVLGALGPWLYLSIRRSRRLNAFQSGLADTLQLMSSSLSAGLSLAQSMDTVVREGQEPVASEFRRVIVESRLGVPLEDALDGVSVRMESRDFTWVVMAIRIQRQVGGNLAELLTTVAATLREREYLRRHVRALSAEGRLSCWVLAGLPPVFLAYLVLSKPSYVEVLFSDARGWLMLGFGAVMLLVGTVWMNKVAKVDI